jgi:AcrR family transcriptional regulator
MSDLKPAAHSKTKDQLLEHAVPLFAKKGYRDATCADLSKLAGANIAAINYHFGSKENLYRLALRRAFEFANAKYPFHGGLEEKASAEQKLHACMEALIRRNYDDGPAGHLNRMINHQVSRPTAPHNLVMEEITQLQGNYLLNTLKHITGPLPELLMQSAKMNIIALCIFPSLAPAMKNFLFPESPSPEEINAIITRQFHFALAGLQTLKP